MNLIPNGVWPTMVTPFNKDLTIDYKAAKEIAAWYKEKGCAGIFAVCQSSEMFFLELDERIKLANAVNDATDLPVIASGHISDSLDEQIIEINEIAQTGVAAVVLVTNRLASDSEDDDVWKKNLEYLLKNVDKNIALGVYECPYPYKRLISPELLKWCIQTQRFVFYKDTSCDADIIEKRLNIVSGTDFKIFNANSATLLETLEAGASGFSGVMANFHPDLYVWLIDNWKKQPKKAKLISDYLGIASLFYYRNYPKCAKFGMNQMGLSINEICRIKISKMQSSSKKEVKQLLSVDDYIRKNLV